MTHSFCVGFKVHASRVSSLDLLPVGFRPAFSLFSFLFVFVKRWESFKKEPFFRLYLAHLHFADCDLLILTKDTETHAPH